MHSLRLQAFFRRWLLGAALAAALGSGVSPVWGQQQPPPAQRANQLQTALQRQFPASQARVTTQTREGKDVFVVQGFASDVAELNRIRQLALAELGLEADPGRLLMQVQVQPRPEGRADEVISVGETRILKSPTGRALKRVVVSRTGIVTVEVIQRDEVQIVGQSVGITRLTFIDTADVATDIIVRVEPDLTFIRQVLEQQFPRASVTLIPAGGNVVIASGTVDAAEDIAPLLNVIQGFGLTVINHIRVGGVMQVQLEVCVARVFRSEFRQIGFNFFQSDEENLLASTVGNLTTTPSVLINGGVVQNPAATILPDGGIGVTPAGATNLFFGIFDDSWAFVGFLRALREESLAKILANPTLVAFSGRPATFLVGGEQAIPVPTGSATGQVGIEFREFGTRLTFVPIVLGEGKIRLEVEPEVSTLSNVGAVNIAGFFVQGRETQRVHTTVEMESGQTLVIGGLLQTEVDSDTLKVPVLGDLPFVGTLFRRVQYVESETELLVLVTPRLVDPLDCSQRVTKLPGQETRTPTDFELFLEGILEAPRGPRTILVDHTYRPAHWPYPCEDGVCGPNGPGCGTCPAGSVPGNGPAVAPPATLPPADGALGGPMPAGTTAVQG